MKEKFMVYAHPYSTLEQLTATGEKMSINVFSAPFILERSGGQFLFEDEQDMLDEIKAFRERNKDNILMEPKKVYVNEL